MALKTVLAMIREEALEPILEALRAADVPGVSINEVRGYGEYINGFIPGELDVCYRLEMFVSEDQVGEVEKIILETACTGGKGDGIIAVSNVDYLLRIRDGERLS